MSKRRANHEGSIRQVQGRYLWQGRIMIEGKRRTLYGSSRDEVRQQITSLQAAADTGNLPKQMKITVQEWLTVWLDTYCMVKESSRTKYESMMVNHIFPTIGHIALQKLTSQHVQRLYNQKFREGKSAKTIKDMHGILHKPLERPFNWVIYSVMSVMAVTCPRRYRKKCVRLRMMKSQDFFRRFREQDTSICSM